MIMWLTKNWWSYLLKDCKGPAHFLCRMRGHPCGVVWFTSDPNACEPDMHCKDCGEDLG